MRARGYLVLLLLFSACEATAATPPAAPRPNAAPTTTTSVAHATTLATTPPRSTWRVLATGDVLLDDTEAAGVDAFAHVAPKLADADLAIVNLETAVAEAGIGTAATKSFTFRTPPSAARTLARAGVDVASLANNHSLDYGPVALLAGIDHLQAAGVDPVGAGRNATEAGAALSRLVGGQTRVAVLGASRVMPEASWTATAQRPGLATAYETAGLLARVQAAATTHDVVIVVVHWGIELATCPQPEVVALAGRLQLAGADLIVGSHPHVLQPIVRNEAGVIAYSLGNFVFHRRTGPTGDTVLLDVSFDGGRVTSVTSHPHVLHAGPPRPADAAGAMRIRAALDPTRCGLSP